MAVWRAFSSQIKLKKQLRKFLWNCFSFTSSPPLRVWMRRHLTDSVGEWGQQLWRDKRPSRAGVSRMHRAVGQDGAAASKQHHVLLGFRWGGFISVITGVPESDRQSGEGAWPPEHTTSLLQHQHLAVFAAVVFLGTRNSSLINLIISPYFGQLGFPGMLAISTANFPVEDHFNCSFAAKNAVELSVGISSCWLCSTWLGNCSCAVNMWQVRVGREMSGCVSSLASTEKTCRDYCTLTLHHVNYVVLFIKLRSRLMQQGWTKSIHCVEQTLSDRLCACSEIWAENWRAEKDGEQKRKDENERWNMKQSRKEQGEEEMQRATWTKVSIKKIERKIVVMEHSRCWDTGYQ